MDRAMFYVLLVASTNYLIIINQFSFLTTLQGRFSVPWRVPLREIRRKAPRWVPRWEVQPVGCKDWAPDGVNVWPDDISIDRTFVKSPLSFFEQTAAKTKKSNDLQQKRPLLVTQVKRSATKTVVSYSVIVIHGPNYDSAKLDTKCFSFCEAV